MLKHLSQGALTFTDLLFCGQMLETQPGLREDLAAGTGGINGSHLKHSSPGGLWLSRPHPTALMPHKDIPEMFNATEKSKTYRKL